MSFSGTGLILARGGGKVTYSYDAEGFSLALRPRGVQVVHRANVSISDSYLTLIR